MFNPSDLPVLVGGTAGDLTFVGVKRNDSGQMEFRIPVGFEDFPVNDSEQVNRLFFDLYKIFRRFAKTTSISRDQVKNSRDGNIFQQQGFSFTDKDDEVVTLYSKIPMLEAVLNSYDDLRVFLLTAHNKKTNQINYAAIDRYLSKAIYLDNHTAYIDAMVIPKDVVLYDVSDLVRMYCFIYLEVIRALNEQSELHNEIEAQAEIFKGQHLRGDSGLFVEAHNDTIALLKDTLQEIHRQVTWKNPDYWYFFEVIERFLYGDVSNNTEGENWGISKFSLVWEDICLDWVFARPSRENILFADTSKYTPKKVGAVSVYVKKSFDNPFYFQYENKKRHIRPDLVKWDDATTLQETFYNTFKESKVIKSDKKITYSIKLLREDEKTKKWFENLQKYLKISGFRHPTVDKKNWIVSGVAPEQHYANAIRFVRMDIEAEITRGSAGEKHIQIVDFKYVPKEIYTATKLKDKAMGDVRKQVVYEAAIILNNVSHSVSSQFCIPRFYSNRGENVGEVYCEVPIHELNGLLQKKKIEVIEIDFIMVSSHYVSLGLTELP